MVLHSKKAILLAKKEGGQIVVTTGVNDALDFGEDGGGEIQSTLSAGIYTPTTLAAEIQTQMRADGDNNATCVYSTTTKKYTIANASLTTLELKWQSGTNTATTIGDYIGFSIAADDTGAKTYTGDNAAAYGSDPTPAVSADEFEVISDLTVTPVGNLQARMPFGNTISQSRPLLGSRWVELSFVVELKGSGTSETPPKGIDALLEACGMDQAIGATEVTYTPTSTTNLIPSCTIWIYLDGTLHKVNGCRGSFKLILIAGETGKIEFTFMGFYAIPTDVAIASPTYDSTVPPTVLSVSFTFDSTSFRIPQLELDLANVLSVHQSMNEATGVPEVSIVNREPKGVMAPEAAVLATYDFFTIWTGSTEKAISVVVGTADGNKFTITAPKAVVESVGYEDRDGVRAYAIPFRLGKSATAGDDEIQIVQNNV